MIGAVLNDRYKIEKKIGQGGFGTVYRGFDANLKRAVAIKILDRAGDDTRFQERFRREAESLAGLNHPNIVTVHDFGESGGSDVSRRRHEVGRRSGRSRVSTARSRSGSAPLIVAETIWSS